MKVPAAAAEIAGAALATLNSRDRDAVDLPAVIAAGGLLTDAHANRVAQFFANVPTAHTPEYRLAANLLGGEPMRRAVTAAATSEEAAGEPDPGPHTGAMIALIPTDDQWGDLAVIDGLPPEDLHITLAFLGPAEEIPDIVHGDIVDVIADLAERWPPLEVEATHVAHLGPPDEPAAVALEFPTPILHEFRADLVAALDAAGIEYSNRYAFRPHMTLTYLPRDSADLDDWPEGPRPPLRLRLSKILARIGPDVAEIDTLRATSAPEPPESPVTAAAAPPALPALSSSLDALNAELAAIDDAAGIEIRTAIDLGWRSALDRVGRMATRQADASLRPGLQSLEPAAVAILAAGTVNPGALIAPAVADTARHVRGVVTRTQATAAAAIGNTFGVDVTDDTWPAPADVEAFTAATLTRALLARLEAPQPDRIDPTEGDADPYVPPYQITRDVLAYAGGGVEADGAISRDDLGRPVGPDGRAGGDAIALGPATMTAVADSIAVWADDAVTADARRRRGANISDALRADLASAAASLRADAPEPLEQTTVHTWRLNMNGRAAVNLPRHERMAGTTISTLSELNSIDAAQVDPNDWPGVSVSKPGDHYHCHCGWETRIVLIPRQTTLPI